MCRKPSDGAAVVTADSLASTPPPAVPRALDVRRKLLKAGGFLVVGDMTHRRRRVLPACGRPVGLPQVPVGVAEGGEGLALTVPIADLTEDRERLLVAGDGFLEPPRIQGDEAQV